MTPAPLAETSIAVPPAAPLRFLRWWGAELAALVPPLAPRRRWLAAGTVPQRRPRAGEQAVLCLPEAAALTRTIRLLRPCPDLAAALAAELERQTPFRPDQAHVAVAEVAREAEALRLRVVLVPRHAVDPALAVLAEAGIAVHALAVGEPAARPAPLIALRPAARRRPLAAGALAVALAAAAVSPFLHHAGEMRRLDAELAAAEAASRAVLALQDRQDRAAAAVAPLAQAGRPLAVLADLAARLPREAWLHSLLIGTEGVEIGGSAPDAAALVPLVEASPLLSGAAPRGPIQRQPDGREQFGLAAGWEAP